MRIAEAETRSTPLPAAAVPTCWRNGVGALFASRAAAMVAIGIVFLVLYLFAYPRSLGERQAFNSPRENVGYLLSQRFVDGEGFRYPLQHYDELPPDIARALTPRDAAEIDGQVVPKDFAGTMLFHAPLFAVWQPLVLVVTPLFAVLSAFALAKIGEELFDRRVGFVAFLVWLAYPPLFINASYIFTSDTIALFSLLVATLFFLRFWREGRRADLVGMTVALGFSVLMRYPSVIVAAVFGLALLEARRLQWRDALLGVTLLAPFALTILIFNRLVYGGFTVTGFHLGAGLLADTANFSKESFFKFRPEVMVGYLRSYVLEWPVMLGPQVLGLLSGLYVVWRTPALRVPILILLASTVILALYYLPQDAWGWTNAQVNASLLRYMLPALAIWTVFVIHRLLRITAGRPVIAGVAIVLLLGGYGWTSWAGPAGVRDTHRVVANSRELRQQVMAATEPDALVASRIMDKVLFPERQTVTMTYLLDSEGPIDKARRHTWQFLPERDRFADVAVRVHERGIPMYLLADFDWRIAKEYDAALREHGFRLRNMRRAYPYFENVGFYKVVPLDQ